MKNLLVTLNIGGKGVFDNARRSFLAAADRWGCDFLEIRRPTRPSMHHWEEKLHIAAHIGNGYRCVYYDGDVVIRHDCPSPFDVVPRGSLGLVRNHFPSHSGTLGTVKAALLPFAKGLELDIDAETEYCNSGMMLFELPLHRPLFTEAYRIVREHGFNTHWVIADQGVYSLARKRLEIETVWIPPMFQYHGEDLWAGWTAEMKTLGYHFCGPINKEIGVSRTSWDDLGPDRKVKGTNVVRWRTGKPISLHGNGEIPYFIRELSRIHRGRIVEVGSFFGGSAWYGGQVARDNYSEYYCVDPWNFNGDVVTSDVTYQGFLENMRDAGLEDVVRPIRKPSMDAAADFEDESVDLVFIDGDHTEAGCGSDIDAWWPKLKIGGTMLGHDYCQRLHGVVRAVNSRFGFPDEISPSDYPIWKIRKDAVDMHRRSIPAPDVLEQQLADSFKGKRVAIVGGSGTALGRRLGELIDDHDIVLRLEHLNEHGTIEDIGTRCDILVVDWNNNRVDRKAIEAWRPAWLFYSGILPLFAYDYLDRSWQVVSSCDSAMDDVSDERLFGAIASAVIHWLVFRAEVQEIDCVSLSIEPCGERSLVTSPPAQNVKFDLSANDLDLLRRSGVSCSIDGFPVPVPCKNSVTPS